MRSCDCQQQKRPQSQTWLKVVRKVITTLNVAKAVGKAAKIDKAEKAYSLGFIGSDLLLG